MSEKHWQHLESDEHKDGESTAQQKVIGIAKRPVNSEVVGALAVQLERAKAGEIVGFVLASDNGKSVTYSKYGPIDRVAATGLLFNALWKLQEQSE